jgi:S1-C subfamily serine protease
VLATGVYFLGLPIRVNPAIIGGVEPGSPEAKMGIHAGDRIVAVNDKLVTSWDDVQMTTAMAPTNVLPVTVERSGVKTTYDLTAKVNEDLGLKLLNLEPSERPIIEEVRQRSAAARAGLKQGDQVVSFAGVPIAGDQQLVGLIKKRPGQPSQIEIMRGPQQLALTVTTDSDPTTKAGVLGVVIAPNPISVYQLQKPGRRPGNSWPRSAGRLSTQLPHWSTRGRLELA